jgi:isopenicillin-N epimerase
MLGSMAAIPCRRPSSGLWTGFERDDLQAALVERFGIEVPVFTWSPGPARILRISAQIYNEPSEYTRLGEAVAWLLEAKT